MRNWVGKIGRWLAINALVAAAYWAVARLMLGFALDEGFATINWPSAGIGLAAVLRAGAGAAPGIALGSFLANLPAAWSDSPSLGGLALPLAFALQAAGQALLGARFIGRALAAKDEGPDRLAYRVIGACALAAAAGALVSTAAMSALAGLPFRAAPIFFVTWWIGDFSGALLLLPLAGVLRRGDSSPSPSLTPWLPLSLLLLASGAGWLLASSRLAQAHASELTRYSEYSAVRLQRLMGHAMSAVHSANALMRIKPGAGVRDWRLLYEAEVAAAPVPGLQALAWMSWSGAGDSARTIITIIEPLTERNRRALGYETSSDKLARWPAIRRAVDEGRPVMTAPLRLLQEDGQNEQTGVLYLTPVYRGGAVPATVAERRRLIQGLAYAPFRLGEFLDEISHTLPQGASIVLSDKASGKIMAKIGHADDATARRGARIERSFPVADRIWSVSVIPPPAKLNGALAPLLALLLLALCLAVFLVLDGAARARAAALLLAERLRAQEQRTDQRLRDLIASTEGIIWEADAQTFTFSSVSDNAERLLGYASEQWLQPGFWKAHIHEEDRQAAAECCMTNTALLQNHDFEYRFLAKDGRVVWLRDIVRVLAENGKPRWLRGLMIDITQQKQADSKLAAQERYLADILNSVTDHIAVLDERAVITKVNQAWKDFAAKNSTDGRGTDWTGANYMEVCRSAPRQLNGEEARDVAKGLESVLAGRSEAFELEYPCHSPSEKRWFLMTIARLTGPQKGAVVSHKNITPRKVAELAMRAAQERFELAALGTNDGIWDWDIVSGKTFFGARWYTMLGYEPDEFAPSYETWQSLLHPDDIRPALEALLAYLEARSPRYEIELRMRMKSGEYRWILVRGVAVRDAKGAALRMAGSHTDIHEWRAAQDELRAANTLHEIYLSALDRSFIVAETDARGVILAVNDRFCEISKYTREELIGKTHKLVNSGAHPPEFWKEFWKTISLGNIWRGDIENRAKDGSVYWVDTTIVPFLGPDGAPVRYLAMRAVITERKAAEQATQAAIDRFALVVRGSNDGIWDWDIATGETFFGPRWYTMLGYENNELEPTYESWKNLIHPDDLRPTMEALTAYLELRAPQYEVDIRLRMKNGDYRWILARGVAVRDAKGAPLRMAGSHTDIHEWRAIQEELRIKNTSLEMLAADRARFIATLSHELRTPLTAVKEGVALVLDGSLGLLNATQAESLGVALRNSDRLNRLINHVLLFSKLQAGKFVARRVPADLAEIAGEVVLALQPLALAKNIGLAASFAEDLPKVLADPDQIQQVLTNLAANAINFTEAGGVEIRLERATAGVKVRVIDTGAGIASADLQNIFKEFEQAKSADSYRVPGGTGLGLAIARGIVEAHGARLEVRSVLTAGSEFSFVLPGVDAA